MIEELPLGALSWRARLCCSLRGFWHTRCSLNSQCRDRRSVAKSRITDGVGPRPITENKEMKTAVLLIALACFSHQARAVDDPSPTPSPMPAYRHRLAHPGSLRRQEQLERRHGLESSTDSGATTRAKKTKADRHAGVSSQADPVSRAWPGAGATPGRGRGQARDGGGNSSRYL
jgi:hypothetical protein